MKIAGIVGGIGPESTVDYYRSILAEWRARRPDGSAPSLVIDSIDVQHMLRLAATDLPALVDHLSAELQRLARAGADFAIFAANTPHLVFDELEARTPLPLLSIVRAACDAARALGLRRLGLLGTRFTMEGRFYPAVFSRAGIALATPGEEGRALVHDRFMRELVSGVFTDATRAEVLAVIRELREREGVEGVLLAGTELPLLLRGVEAGVPLLDTALFHVRACVDRMLG